MNKQTAGRSHFFDPLSIICLCFISPEFCAFDAIHLIHKSYCFLAMETKPQTNSGSRCRKVQAGR